MAASMPRHVNRVLGKQICLINRRLSRYGLGKCMRQVQGIRYKHHETADVIKNSTDRSDDQRSEQRESEYEGKVSLKLASTRRKLRELHNLDYADSLAHINWDADYEMDIQPRKYESSTSSNARKASVIGDDFFGIQAEVDEKKTHKTVSHRSEHENNIKTTKKSRVPPSKRFERILTNKVNSYQGETVLKMPYGVVRRDQDNLVRSHGRVQAISREGFLKLHQQPTPNRHPLVKEQLVPDPSDRVQTPELDSNNRNHYQQNQDNYFDELYFPEQTSPGRPHQILKQTQRGASEEADNNFIEDHFFSKDAELAVDQSSVQIHPERSADIEKSSQLVPDKRDRVQTPELDSNNRNHYQQNQDNYFDELYFPEQTSPSRPHQILKQTQRGVSEEADNNFIEDHFSSKDAELAVDQSSVQIHTERSADIEKSSELLQRFRPSITPTDQSIPTSDTVRPGVTQNTEWSASPRNYNQPSNMTYANSVNLFDEQYFIEGVNHEHNRENVASAENQPKVLGSQTAGTEIDSLGLSNNFEEQFSGTVGGDPFESKAHSNIGPDEGKDHVFDEHYFKPVNGENLAESLSVYESKSRSVAGQVKGNSDEQSIRRSLTDPKSRRSNNEPNQHHRDSENDADVRPGNSTHKAVHETDLQTTNTIHVGGYTKQHRRTKDKIKANTENPETAYDLAMKIRREKHTKPISEDTSDGTFRTPSGHKWSGKVDTKGFRKLKDQVLNIQRVPQDVVVSILKDSILHETDEFIAIDKPYGLPSHGGPGIHLSVGKLAAALASRIGAKELDLVHRLDKETTGVMLLAKTGAMAWRLRQMFKERKVIKRYWVITKGIPIPTHGVIDIPMIETEVGGRYRMNVLPYKSDVANLLIRKHQPDIPRKDAITKYKILDSNHGAALVECEPETGLKHQIRCHMAFGLNTSILGDHKYSHYSKTAPQRLPRDMLHHLGLRQALVRYVPMHLHAKALVLPQLGKEGHNVFISCRLPAHFQQNMKWLKLKPPQGV